MKQNYGKPTMDIIALTLKETIMAGELTTSVPEGWGYDEDGDL